MCDSDGGKAITIHTKKKGAAAPLLVFFYDNFTVLQSPGKDRVTAEFQIPFDDIVLLTRDGDRRTHSHYLATPRVENPDATGSIEIAVVRSGAGGVKPNDTPVIERPLNRYTVLVVIVGYRAVLVIVTHPRIPLSDRRSFRSVVCIVDVRQRPRGQSPRS